MSCPEMIEIEELDCDLEVSGRRFVKLSQAVIPIYSPPEEFSGYRIKTKGYFKFVEELEIGIMDADEWPDYSLSNSSLWYVGIEVSQPQANTQKLYSELYEAFRQEGANELTQYLGLSSWAFGKGISSRRGQDLFIVELSGGDFPIWCLNLSVRLSDTYETLCKLTEKIDHFFQVHYSP